MSYSKGARTERELLDIFWRKGFGVVRVAGSGTSRHEAPDILVGGEGRFLAIECKSRSKKRLYIDKGEIEELEKFSEMFGADPVIAFRFNREDWRFLYPGDMKRTRTGNYKVERADIDRAMSVELLLKNLKQETL